MEWWSGGVVEWWSGGVGAVFGGDDPFLLAALKDRGRETSTSTRRREGEEGMLWLRLARSSGIT